MLSQLAPALSSLVRSGPTLLLGHLSSSLSPSSAASLSHALGAVPTAQRGRFSSASGAPNPLPSSGHEAGQHPTLRSEDIPEISGQVHSLDSFTSVDGPGLRYMIFLQGCVFRCKFCSNPDTWQLKGGTVMTSKEIAARIKRVAPYLRANKGGITCSGGEPMLQPYFLAALFQEAHAMGLTTCLDTTGQGNHSHWNVILPHTDHVLLCPKAPDSKMYEDLTGQKQGGMIKFAKELADRNIPTWLRYVMIPGMTDRDSDVEWMGKFVAEHPNIQMVDLLPLHRLGVNKWREMGLKYPLEQQRLPTRAEVEAFAARLKAAGCNVVF